ncbi:hypothetical protein [Streptomyces celluloflavus]|uniref:Integral membrane protein n=1 Tax=Streptomyces celluloflavus TaxID=58344 RepID=A0ABW7R7G2_9ACTN|nr:hypothetical protein OG717_16350 [Streptomyces celluloflavus]
MGAGLLVLSLLPALVCSFAFAVMLPYDIEEFREYGVAKPCPARAAVERLENCLRTVSFTVDSTEIKNGKSATYKATVSGARFWNGVVVFGDSGPLLDRLRPGDRITGTVWRGGVMTLSGQGVRQSSSDEPRDEPQWTAAVGTFTGLLAALGLEMGAVRLIRPRDHERWTWHAYGKPLFITMTIACFGVGFSAFLLDVPWWAVPPVPVLVVVYAAWLLHRLRKQTATRGA